MKLPQLNSAIRAADNVKIAVNFGGLHIEMAVQKTSLLEGLKDAFPDKGETGLWIREDGFITRESSREPNPS